MKGYLFFIWLGIYSILSSCANCPEKQELKVCQSKLSTSERQNRDIEAKLEICEQAVSKSESALATCEQEKNAVVSKSESELAICEQEKNAVGDKLETFEQMRKELQTNLQKCEQENRYYFCITACQSEFQSALLDCQDDVKDMAAPIVKDKAMNECLKNEGFPEWKNSCPKRCEK